EQVMQIARVLGKYSLGEADILRRAMGKKQPEEMAKQRVVFTQGATQRGIATDLSESVFDLMEKFAGYGFNKSHSAAYAMISYRTAYLKANFPVEFMTALLTGEKNNSDKISDYINEAIQMGIDILPPDVNESFKDFTVVGNGIRFGISAVKNVGEGAAEAIIMFRQERGKFESIYDFAQKVDARTVNRKVVESLIKCGAFDSTKLFRSQGMAVLDKVLEMASKTSRDRNMGQLSFFDDENADESFRENFYNIPDIPEWAEYDLLAQEKEMLGFYITKHPLARFERLLNAYSTARISELAGMGDGQTVLIGGIINKVRVTVTRKKKEKMAIVSLGDLDNFIEVLVFPRAYRKSPELIKVDNLVYISGKLNLREEEPKIVAEDIIPLEKVKESFTKSVLIKMSTVVLEERTMIMVKDLIKKFKGKTPVFVDLTAPEGRKIRLSMDKDLLVHPSDELIDEMENIIGKGNIKFLTK
ncbi:MAG: DNA polymerase III subunit alpha, partial [Candidatus Omnitrophica bacterium]|nr:DNA polymerase III subunit alpha [Candidatus Omnitrophota bacterium]